MSAGTILILDDDRDILELEGALLQHEGFRIIASESIEEALELIRVESPDIVMLDLVFPEDPDFGSKAAHSVRKAYPGLPIFLLTAINRRYLTGITEDRSDFDEILSKPIQIDKLIKLFERYIDKDA